jgi:hypothetical protein
MYDAMTGTGAPPKKKILGKQGLQGRAAVWLVVRVQARWCGRQRTCLGDGDGGGDTAETGIRDAELLVCIRSTVD